MSRNKKTDQKRLLEQLDRTPIIEAACKRSGLPRSTYYRWRKEDQAFADKCDEVIDLSIGRITDLAESQLINAIKDRQLSAITFWLRAHHIRYRNKVDIDANITTKYEISDEQKAVIENALQLAGLTEGEQNE